MDRHLTAATMVGLAVAPSPIAAAHAAELKVLAGGTMTVTLQELGPQFERATGNKLTFQFDSTPNLIKAVTSGASFALA
jgi:molybdate transport system substrate-binding protein